ncbi:MAG: methyltransferase domain-containing protein [Thermoleophilaceae bacterium]|nr:methyltransferase domain-containing protein [Thermoleophilaceae bacterium]MBA3839543.1 methyltransferase domain-containing protein [Thermoleophilaceae bacterium]
MDVERLKANTREAWTRGHYPALAEILAPAARVLVDACAISAGQEVLDVGAGTGNVAVLAAEEGALVVASDLTPHLIEQGRARTDADGLEVEWVEADVEALPFADDSFECLASCFGAIFAPRPEVAAAEMFRVVRPGGTVGLTSWAPDGYFGRAQAIAARYQPPPEGVPRPFEWGREEVVRERLGDLAASLSFERLTLPFAFASVDGLWEFFAENAGPWVATREELSDEAWEGLRQESVALAAEWNRAEDGSLRIDSEYLLAVARRRG